jgi:hypothetical protein
LSGVFAIIEQTTIKEKMSTKKFQFWASNLDSKIGAESVKKFIPKLEPARLNVPEWYKKVSRYLDDNNKPKVYEGGGTNAGIKTCVPFLDAITSGYVIKLHTDLIIEDGTITWSHNVPPLSPRNHKISDQIPNIPGYSKFTSAWELFYSMKLPEGYSAIFTQPFNRFDLPFMSSTGIMDLDTGIGPGAVPFAVKDGFNGMIPAGTPIVQIIPFKREDWALSYSEEEIKINWNPRSHITGWYKKNLWKKKTYE